MEESSLAVAGKLLCQLPRRPCCASSFISPVHKTRACEEHKAPWCSLTWKTTLLIKYFDSSDHRCITETSIWGHTELASWNALLSFPLPQPIFTYSQEGGCWMLRAGHSFLWRHLCLLTRTHLFQLQAVDWDKECTHRISYTAPELP